MSLSLRRLVPSGLSVLALVGLAAGCGNLVDVHDAGQVGLSVSADGHPLLVLSTCEKARPVVSMYRSREDLDDDQPNQLLGEWTARTPTKGLVTLDLTAPGDAWTTGTAAAALDATTTYTVDAGTVEDDEASLGGVFFTRADLAKLTPGTALVRGKVEPIGELAAYECDA